MPILDVPAAVSRVPSSATSVELFAANANRQGAVVHNNSTGILYIKYGTAATTISYTYKVFPGAHWDMPTRYPGIIHGIWSSANGFAQTTDIG